MGKDVSHQKRTSEDQRGAVQVGKPWIMLTMWMMSAVSVLKGGPGKGDLGKVGAFKELMIGCWGARGET